MFTIWKGVRICNVHVSKLFRFLMLSNVVDFHGYLCNVATKIIYLYNMTTELIFTFYELSLRITYQRIHEINWHMNS